MQDSEPIALAAPLSLAQPDSPSDDYDRVAQAIAFIRQHQQQQPDLATIARHVHLSEHHFQRLFSRWAGISPKRFLQSLTAEHAKAALASRRSVLETALAAGLSGPGRLHDLMVTVEAISPGEYKAGGAGLTIGYGVHSTPFGSLLVAQTGRGLCQLQFLEKGQAASAVAQLQQAWPQAQLVEAAAATQAICDRIFCRALAGPNAPPLPVWVKGTNFQIQVWRALLQIPAGQLATYQDLAVAIGRPTAARAVGTAVGRNPIAYLIPCHRVICASGEIGGYRWGRDRKAAMLAWEAGRTATDCTQALS